MINKYHLILMFFIFIISCAAPIKSLYPPKKGEPGNKKILIYSFLIHPINISLLFNDIKIKYNGKRYKDESYRLGRSSITISPALKKVK